MNKQMIDRAVKDAPRLQFINAYLWAIFRRQKADKLMRCISGGMTWELSYQLAKRHKSKIDFYNLIEWLLIIAWLLLFIFDSNYYLLLVGAVIMELARKFK